LEQVAGAQADSADEALQEFRPARLSAPAKSSRIAERLLQDGLE
jgi:hypothetical protein